MSTQQIPTFEELREMFRQTDLRIDRMSKETNRQIKRVSRDIGRLGNRIGDIIEHMVGAALS